eukprot:7753417-Pyramimonas_sp.AAC.1
MHQPVARKTHTLTNLHIGFVGVFHQPSIKGNSVPTAQASGCQWTLNKIDKRPHLETTVGDWHRRRVLRSAYDCRLGVLHNLTVLRLDRWSVLFRRSLAALSKGAHISMCSESTDVDMRLNRIRISGSYTLSKGGHAGRASPELAARKGR